MGGTKGQRHRPVNFNTTNFVVVNAEVGMLPVRSFHRDLAVRALEVVCFCWQGAIARLLLHAFKVKFDYCHKRVDHVKVKLGVNRAAVVYTRYRVVVNHPYLVSLG